MGERSNERYSGLVNALVRIGKEEGLLLLLLLPLLLAAAVVVVVAAAVVAVVVAAAVVVDVVVGCCCCCCCCCCRCCLLLLLLLLFRRTFEISQQPFFFGDSYQGVDKTTVPFIAPFSHLQQTQRTHSAAVTTQRQPSSSPVVSFSPLMVTGKSGKKQTLSLYLGRDTCIGWPLFCQQHRTKSNERVVVFSFFVPSTPAPTTRQ